jgi:hypothetical protein
MASDHIRFRRGVFVLLVTGATLLSCQHSTSHTDRTFHVGNMSDSFNADTGPNTVADPHYQDPHYQDPLGDQILNGTCAPEGESFTSVYSCGTVQGPSASEPPGAVSQVTHNPATVKDPDYDWVLGQLSACSCTCCHTGVGIGTYRWSSTFERAWTDSADSEALNGLQSVPPGAAPAAIPPGENNGFSRESTSHPTTDPQRFRSFILRELDRRNE